MRILIINGPNLNMLGKREPEIYGGRDYAALCREVLEYARGLGAEAEFFQSNSEGGLIDAIQAADGRFDGIVINPGAYTHYSYAIHDALKGISVPAVEVHLSNIGGREEFRRASVVAPACAGQISGLGFFSYFAAVRYFAEGGQ